MSVARQGTLVPNHPSNRRVVDQMILWGWEPGKSDGRWQEMEAPPFGAGKAATIQVRPATQHDANPTSIFREIYRLTTQGNAEMFWAGPGEPEAWADMVKQARLRAKKHRDELADLKINKAAERAKRLTDAIQKPKEEPMVQPPVKPLRVSVDPKTTRVRSQDVFEILVDHDRPMTTKAIAKALGMDPEVIRNTRDISNRCTYLVGRGLAERLMGNTYRAAAGGLAIAARVQHDVTSSSQPEHHPVRAVPTAAEPPSPLPSPVPEPVKVKVLEAESVDDTIEAVLDLLLPDGFRAVDLKIIEQWVAATKTMIEKVQR